MEHPLRSNTVHTLTRENTGANVGYRVPIVHWDFVPDWDGLDVKCVPKGSGSENMTFLKMLVPADGVNGIKRFVLESIVGAGGKPCPPGIVGVGIGGSADYAMHLAKEAIARPVGTRNPDPLVAQLEDELYGLLNETGIGPMGLGGDVTVLQCHIEHADTHMTLNPVAVNYQCWAARRASAHISRRRHRRVRQGVLRWRSARSEARGTRRCSLGCRSCSDRSDCPVRRPCLDRRSCPVGSDCGEDSPSLRHDVVVGNDVESAVRVAGGIPTLGGGVRARRFSTGGVRTGHELAASRKAVRAVAAPGRIDA